MRGSAAMLVCKIHMLTNMLLNRFLQAFIVQPHSDALNCTALRLFEVISVDIPCSNLECLYLKHDYSRII